MERIRICFAVDADYAGGAERYITLLASGLSRDRYDVAALVKRGDGLDAWCRELAVAGVAVSRVDMGLPHNPGDMTAIRHELRRLRPEIVHINAPGPYDGQMGLLAPIARRAGARAVIVTEHLPMVERLWKRALIKRWGYRSVDRVITVCQDNVRFLLERQRVAAGKIAVVYNGIPRSFGTDAAAMRAAARDHYRVGDDVVLAFVGALTERKGLGVLLDALATLSPQGWRLLVAGGGPDGEAFRARTAQLGIDERVNYVGELSASAVERLLAASDALVLPSFMEGLPYVILEAMASSLPVVASRTNGIPEAAIDRETAFLFPPGDSASLRMALEELFADGARRQEMGRAGRARFEQLFTLQTHIAEMDALYGRLLPNDGER